MYRVAALLAAAIAISAAGIAQAQVAPANAPQVSSKLHDLGYPADPEMAIQRWRADTGRRGTGALDTDETAALLAQPMPEFFGAMVGNPFTGMGVAMRHTSRADAERDAIEICKDENGGAACVMPVVVRAEQCVAVAGYNVTIDRRPTYRVSVAISTDSKLAMSHAKEACQTGATHPGSCRPLLKFCGDGREAELFDEKPGADASKTAAR